MIIQRTVMVVARDFIVGLSENERLALAAELALIWMKTPSASTPMLCILRDRLHESSKGR